MKSFLKIYLLISGIGLSFFSAVLAQNQDFKQIANDFATDSPIKRPEDIVNVLKQFVRWFYLIFFILAVYFLLSAAFTYLSQGGSPEGVKKANKTLLWSVVAIVVALISVGFASIIS